MSLKKHHATTPPESTTPIADGGGCSPFLSLHHLSSDSPRHHGLHLRSIDTRRTLSHSTCESGMESSEEMGTVKLFSQSKGHGFITRDSNNEDIFVHISDIEGEIVPKPGDRVQFRLCPIPSKVGMFGAVHVILIQITPEPHHGWDNPEDYSKMQ